MAAVVGAGAIVIGTIDAHEQRKVLSAQLITGQRAYAVHHQPFGGATNQFEFIYDEKGIPAVGLRPFWTNLGNSPTHDLKVWVSNPIPIPIVDIVDPTKYSFPAAQNTYFTPLSLGPKRDMI